MMNRIIKDIINGNHPFAVSLSSSDEHTASGVSHRVLLENGNNDIFMEYMISIMQQYHISPEGLEHYKKVFASFKLANVPLPRSPYPQNLTTQKGNFAEIFLAEYLKNTTEAQLPIYKLRYNPNPDQSMKGDDVLLFDLDTTPARIIVGESKFRTTPDKKSVVNIVDGLVRSNKGEIPVSLMFVAERLYQENKTELAKKVQNCAILCVTDQLKIDYVGLLMSNLNAKNVVNKHTSNDLHNLLMISLGMHHPEAIVNKAFIRLEEGI